MSQPPVCPRCGASHSGAVRCDGTPIDWAARKERARAWVAANKGLPMHKRAAYDWKDLA